MHVNRFKSMRLTQKNYNNYSLCFENLLLSYRYKDSDEGNFVLKLRNRNLFIILSLIFDVKCFLLD